MGWTGAKTLFSRVVFLYKQKISRIQEAKAIVHVSQLFPTCHSQVLPMTNYSNFLLRQNIMRMRMAMTAGHICGAHHSFHHQEHTSIFVALQLFIHALDGFGKLQYNTSTKFFLLVIAKGQNQHKRLTQKKWHDIAIIFIHVSFVNRIQKKVWIICFFSVPFHNSAGSSSIYRSPHDRILFKPYQTSDYNSMSHSLWISSL